MSSARWTGVVLSVLVAAAGVGLRFWDAGRYGFWNDEAWVALVTRVEGLSQLRLVIGPTPIGFAMLLRAFPETSSELALRSVPLLFGCATMAVAWRLGLRAAGMAGALVALAAVAFDPLEIAYATQLKQYTAEAFLAVLALDALLAFALAPSRRTVRRIAATLSVGIVFGTAQLFVVGPVLAVASTIAVGLDDRALRRRALVVFAATTAWVGAWYLVVVAPRVTGQLSAYFANDYVPVGSLGDVARFVEAELAGHLGAMLGRHGWLAGVVALGALGVVDRRCGPIAVAVVLLMFEMIGLGMARRVPFGAERVMLFCYTATGATLAVALGAMLSRLAAGALGPVFALGLAVALAADVAVPRDWRRITESARIEDVGPLIRAVEAERTPDDVLLLYERSLFPYAYYQRARPVLVPSINPTGFVPDLTDPRVRLLGRMNLVADIDRAFADAAVVWFVGSRMGAEEAVVERLLRQHGTVTRRATRTDALLLRIERRTPPG